jgi:hypothetical protein
VVDVLAIEFFNFLALLKVVQADAAGIFLLLLGGSSKVVGFKQVDLFLSETWWLLPHPLLPILEKPLSKIVVWVLSE